MVLEIETTDLEGTREATGTGFIMFVFSQFLLAFVS